MKIWYMNISFFEWFSSTKFKFERARLRETLNMIHKNQLLRSLMTHENIMKLDRIDQSISVSVQECDRDFSSHL